MSSPGVSPPPLKRRCLSATHPCKEPPAISDRALSIDPQQPFHPVVPTFLRIFSWNIDGIQPFLPSSTPKITNFLTSTSKPKITPSVPSLRTNLHSWRWPHICFLQEVKIASADTKTPTLLRRSVNEPHEQENKPIQAEQLYDVHLCLPRDKHNATGFGGKIYGVCTLIRQDLAPATTIRTVGWDLEGRVQVLDISSFKLAVINVYAVNGTTYEYRDPETGKVVGTRHDRKKAFHSLLAQEVKAYEANGWQVVIAGDINVSRSEKDSFPQLRMGEEHIKNRADFEEKFIKELGLLDTFRFLHSEEKKYSYRPRNKPWGAGGDRVDIILVTRGLRDRVREADVLDSEDERGPSDHVPLLIELEMKRED